MARVGLYRDTFTIHCLLLYHCLPFFLSLSLTPFLHISYHILVIFIACFFYPRYIQWATRSPKRMWRGDIIPSITACSMWQTQESIFRMFNCTGSQRSEYWLEESSTNNATQTSNKENARKWTCIYRAYIACKSESCVRRQHTATTTKRSTKPLSSVSCVYMQVYTVYMMRGAEMCTLIKQAKNKMEAAQTKMKTRMLNIKKKKN